VYLYGSQAITYVNAILWVVTEPPLWVIKLPQTAHTPHYRQPSPALYGSITFTHLDSWASTLRPLLMESVFQFQHPVSQTGTRLGPLNSVPDWFWNQHFHSFRYQNDALLDSPGKKHLNKVERDLYTVYRRPYFTHTSVYPRMAHFFSITHLSLYHLYGHKPGLFSMLISTLWCRL